MDNNLVVKLAFEFSLAIIDFCEILEQQKKFVISKQLLRAATSIDANIVEAQNAESKADFIHKFKIGAKEGEETEYWLLLCDFSPNYPDCKELLLKIETLNKIIGKIISTSKQKHPINHLLSLFLF